MKTDEVAATETKKNAYNGKWKVEKTDDDKVFATLTASNGGSLLSTQGYSNINGLKTARVQDFHPVGQNDCNERRIRLKVPMRKGVGIDQTFRRDGGYSRITVV